MIQTYTQTCTLKKKKLKAKLFSGMNENDVSEEKCEWRIRYELIKGHDTLIQNISM